MLARLALAGAVAEREALRRSLPDGVRRRWWRPRGLRSALRRRGLEQTRIAQQLAEAKERCEGVAPRRAPQRPGTSTIRFPLGVGGVCDDPHGRSGSHR